jgi:hypothetical protein
MKREQDKGNVLILPRGKQNSGHFYNLYENDLTCADYPAAEGHVDVRVENRAESFMWRI